MGTDIFFGLHIDPLSLAGQCAVLLLAVLLGGLIGLERQLHGNAAGLRTHIMVCVGSAVITLTSVEIGMDLHGVQHGDPGHIAAQIVSGIGFLGAGAILRDGLSVRGLTTAASIWATAGIGIALGASPHLGELAVFATGISLLTLVPLARLESHLKGQQRVCALEVEVLETHDGAGRVLDLLGSQGIVIYGIQSEAGQAALQKGATGPTRQMQLRVQLPHNFDRKALNRSLLAERGVVAFHLEDC